MVEVISVKVKELIEVLSKLDQEAEIWKANWYYDRSEIEVIQSETFRNDDDEEITAYVIK